jgi:hypothetical protein
MARRCSRRRGVRLRLRRAAEREQENSGETAKLAGRTASLASVRQHLASKPPQSARPRRFDGDCAVRGMPSNLARIVLKAEGNFITSNTVMAEGNL